MGCLCCKSVGIIDCGFFDNEFTSNLWSDPDALIANGDIEGTATSQNEFVSSAIRISDVDKYTIFAEVEVSDTAIGAALNQAGFVITGIPSLNVRFNLQSPEGGATASSVLIDGVGTPSNSVSRSTNNRYRISIEFVNTGTGTVIVTWLAILLDSISNTPIRIYSANSLEVVLPAEGIIRLNAQNDAKILAFGVECENVTQICQWCDTGTVPSRLKFELSGVSDFIPEFTLNSNGLWTQDEQFQTPCVRSATREAATVWIDDLGRSIDTVAQFAIRATFNRAFQAGTEYVDVIGRITHIIVDPSIPFGGFRSDNATFRSRYVASGGTIDCVSKLPNTPAFEAEIVHADGRCANATGATITISEL